MSRSPFQSRTASRAPEHVSGAGSRVRAHRGQPIVALVGNPNCGKSTVFNALTGGSRAVGNWAGVTIDSGFGTYAHGGREIGMVDLPGVYSLSPSTADERVTREFVVAARMSLIVNVLDASNLERNLYLTMQLIELGLPMVVVLNMGDTAAHQGVTVDPAALSNVIGIPVVEVCASRRAGMEALRASIDAALAHPAIPTVATVLEPALEAEVQHLASLVDDSLRGAMSARWASIRLFEFDSILEDASSDALVAERDAAFARIEDALDEESDILIADARYEQIGAIARSCVHHRGRIGATRTERLDRIALHQRWGIPVFLGVMYLMFLLTINVGSAFIDLFDQLGGLLFVDIPAAALGAIGLPDVLVVLLANGLGGGMQSVATFVPPVGIMFLCLRFLEESGYMARAAFVMDRFMRGLGLPGKAFVPMIVGFGCNVPAIMGTRTLERERDRKMAVALNPFMSCGARLPVYALFAAAFFPASGQLVVFALYLLGIAFAVMTGLILKRTMLTGELTPFVMELPPYHHPSATSVLKGAWARLKGFIVGAGKLIVPVVAVLTLLGSTGTDGSFGNDNTDQSVLSSIGRAITPVFSPMGIEQDNWPATVGIFTGIFAKEAVVGSLDALYSQIDSTDRSTSAEPEAVLDPAASVGAAFATVPPNVVDAGRSMLDPLGLSVGTVDDPAAAAEEQGVDRATYGAMVSRFDGQVGAFAYLVFILLYLPCVAATAAIYRETGRSWALFVGCWTTGLAFMAATITYQLATFLSHPGTSAAWVVGLVGVFTLVVRRMRTWNIGEDEPRSAPTRSTAPPLASTPAATSAEAFRETPIPPPVESPRSPTSSDGTISGWAPRPIFTSTAALARSIEATRVDVASASAVHARAVAPVRPTPATAKVPPVRMPTPARTRTAHARIDARPAPTFSRTPFLAPRADSTTDA